MRTWALLFLEQLHDNIIFSFCGIQSSVGAENLWLLLVQIEGEEELGFDVRLAFTSEIASELLYNFLGNVEAQSDTICVDTLSFDEEAEKLE